ncbi:visual pigment-like receptor peropsin isoform X2 [Ornithodoros turicata]
MEKGAVVTVGQQGTPDVVVGSYLVVIGTIGSLLNSVLLAMYIRMGSSLNPTSLLLINLLISDLGILLFGFPFSASSSFHGSWLFEDWGCQLYAFLGFLFGSAHIGTLTFLALDRYLATCRVEFRGKLTYKRYLQLILTVWCYSIFWAAMPLLGWGSYGIEPSVQSCTINWRKNDAAYKSFTIVYFVLGYVAPLLIVIVCYRSSAIHILAPRVANRTADSWANEDTVTWMVVLIILSFFVAWTPYALLCMWAVFGDPWSVPWILALIPPLCAKTCSAMDPFIYFLSNPKIRADVRKLFSRERHTIQDVARPQDVDTPEDDHGMT